MSFRYELACKGHSTEKAQDRSTQGQLSLASLLGR